jgi:hypothetical protein
MLRAATNERGNLYGACPAIKTKIGDVEVEQNFFVQNRGSYPIILGQPYIILGQPYSLEATMGIGSEDF